MDQSPFRKLPGELRIMIYELVVEADVVVIRDRWKRDIDNITPMDYNRSRITETCKEMRSEALPIYYSRLFSGPYDYSNRFQSLTYNLYFRLHHTQYIKKLIIVEGRVGCYEDYWWEMEHYWRPLARMLVKAGIDDKQIEWSPNPKQLDLHPTHCFSCTMKLNMYKFRSANGTPRIPTGCCNIADAVKELEEEKEAQKQRLEQYFRDST